MKIRHIAALLACLFAGISASAEGTRTWEQSKFEEFEKGTAKGVAIRSTGTLELAPGFKQITTTPSTHIWSIAPGKDGAVYLAAGAPARVYRVTPDGKTSVVFQPQELQVQSVVAGDDVIYAATSPDGKVYKLRRERENPEHDKAAAPSAQGAAAPEGWSASVFFQPKTKYIWDLALDREGRLYIATGDRGEIFRVDRNGEGSMFFKSDEAHIRTLAFDPKGNLIAGSDGSGLVYRISPAGEAFVLYSAPKKEITALAIDPAGNIYAAGVGEKRVAPVTSSLPATLGKVTAPGTTPSTNVTGPGVQATGAAPSPTVPTGATHTLPALGINGSEVYRIAPDGSPKRIWSSRDEVVYALSLDSQGHVLAGTGNKGRVFSIQSDQEFTDLVKASANQVTAFGKAPQGGLYVCTSNLGKLFLLGGAPEAEGTYESDVFDARIFSRWGRAEVRGAGPFELWARSGNVDNPDRNWSPWKQVELSKGAELTVPPARFVQWKAVLKAGNPPAQIDSVLLNYLPKNVAPVIDDVIVLAGSRFNPPSRPLGEPSSLPARIEPIPASVRDRSSIAVRWTVHDDNDDQLVYALYYRGDNESRWKLLKDKLTDKFFSFEAGLLPDGGYTIKVVASDAPSHSPQDALQDERESQRFEVDTTPPRIENLVAVQQSNTVKVSFRATDSFSVIKRAEFSLDAGDWQFIEPIGQLSDARTESYEFTVPLSAQNAEEASAGAPLAAPARPAKRSTRPVTKKDPVAAGGEHLVIIRVWDRFDNMAAAKTLVSAK
jgi:sugar lactone lactonase YvrE